MNCDMTCRELAELLLDYLEGRLAQERCAIVQGHLDACPECICFIETYQITVQISRRLPPTSVPEHVLERVRKQMDQPK